MLEPSDLPPYTYDDYVQWEGRWELLEGIAYGDDTISFNPASTDHQKIARLLDEALENCTQCHALLPVDWKITHDTIVQPDNLVVCYEPTVQYLTRAPSVIFEVLSASTRNKDEKVKFRLYETEGVAYYCMVDPAETTVKIFELIEGRYARQIDTARETFVFKLPDSEFAFDCGRLWR